MPAEHPKIALSARGGFARRDAPGCVQQPSHAEHPVPSRGEHCHRTAEVDKPFRTMTGEEGKETSSSSPTGS